MRIAVVGAGVVGGILGGCLLKKGEDVALVDASKGRLARLRSSGLQVRDPKGALLGDFVVHPRKLCASPSELEAPDALFVCVKACVLKDILPALKPAIRPGSVVVSFQNGLDTEDLLAAGLGTRANVLRGVVNYAGRLLEGGEIEVGFFHRPNYLGVLDPSAEGAARELSEVLTSAGLDTEYAADIRAHVWEKVILNSAMSPLSALTGLTMEDVMRVGELKRVVEGIVREGIAVAEASGVRFPEGFFDHCMGYLSKGGRHKPSMLVDVEAGRPTEIDFLSGAISRRGARHGVSAPRNETIAALVKGLEEALRRADGRTDA